MGKFTDAAMDRKIIMGEVLEIKPDDILTISGKFFTLIAGSEFSIFDKGTKVGKILISEVTNEKAEGKIVSASGKISKGMRFGKILPE